MAAGTTWEAMPSWPASAPEIGSPQHGEARRASPSDPLSEALQRPSDRQHTRRDLNATEHGVSGGYNEVAVESELETTAERYPLDRGDRRHPERFDGAVRQIDLGHKGAKPIDVFTGPFPHLASEAEMWSLRFDQHNADVAFTRVMDSLPKTFRKPQVEPVKRGIGENDAPDGIVAFEPDGLHGVKLPGVSPFSSAYGGPSHVLRHDW